MKRNFSLSSSAFALLLAASVTLGSTAYTAAEAKSALNPMNWFSGESADDSAAVAEQRAKEAQFQAEQAMKAAEAAMAKAEQAKKAAEALQQQSAQLQQASATRQAKPVVVPPALTNETEAPTAEESADTDEASNTNTATDAANAETAAKSSNWYKLRLFKKDTPVGEAQTEQTETVYSQETKADTKALKATDAEQQAFSEETQATETTDNASTPSVGTPWNPLSWFSKPVATNSEQPTAMQATETTAVQPKKVAAEDAAPKTEVALIETEKGNIAFELYADQAPITVANFTKLVNDGFYNRFNMKFHRVVPGFVIQTGDPTGTGAGGSKDRIPLEAKNKLSHNTKGVVAMARGADPNSATSQFYITLAPQTSLDGKYAIFGRVVSGMDVLDKIEKGDMLYGIRMVDINNITLDAPAEKKHFFSSLF